eukprot:CAMPEP_0178655726 /NCGR_PEP_ID=MMETSP0698-20121128/24432_1 /TAXON_ID=265572 /ORGANISM="Extubocellulus spinifer, Strain CCMP396" /LENGTH=254 /DNA_ID=CAMNT_0020297709 /DNA_START=113 /DNA_END=878 /DNA_ORIENTATION=+
MAESDAPQQQQQQKQQQQQEPQEEGEAQILVSEFPNPPPYYNLFATLNGKGKGNLLPPPPIPTAKLQATAVEVAKAEAASRRIRDEQLKSGAATAAAAAAAEAAAIIPQPNLDDVVSIFGEIVEDPLLRMGQHPQQQQQQQQQQQDDVDQQCTNPEEIAIAMKSLNRQIMTSFVTLTRVLVHEPKAAREELITLSQLLIRLLEECNRYRDHQARENLIRCLEDQLKMKRTMLKALEGDLTEVQEAAEDVARYCS